MTLFNNRSQAGSMLAKKLEHLKSDPNVLILALPRGGVPVAYEIARNFSLPLDILIVRKLGVPGHEELAMGAIASGGAVFLNHDIIFQLAIDKKQIEKVTEREQAELARREKVYRTNKAPISISGKSVVIVDDGIATGATIKAAIQSLREKKPESISVAVPVAPFTAIDELQRFADEVICLYTPEPFGGVGIWYRDFGQVSDSEVLELLLKCSSKIPMKNQEQSTQL